MNNSDYTAVPKPWEVNKFPIQSSVPLPVTAPAKPLNQTVQEWPLNFRNNLRATIDEVNAKEYEGMVNAPRALPKLNQRQVYEFPVHCLGELIQDAVESIAVITQCHPDIAAQVALGYISLAIQGHVDVRLPWNLSVVPSSLWLVTVADSSDRKTSADKQIAGVVKRWEKELAISYKKAMASWVVAHDHWVVSRAKIMKHESSLSPADQEKAIGPEPVKPPPPVLVSGNPTIEGLRDLILDGAKIQGLFSDDGGTFLGGHSMKAEQVTNTIASLSQMFSGDPVKKLRAGGNWAITDNYRMNAHLMIQPVIANRFLNDKLFRGQGLLSRFLTSWPDSESLSGYRESQDVDPIHYQNIERFNHVLYKLFSAPLPTDPQTKGELQPRILDFTPEAIALYKEWNNSNQRHLRVDGKYYCIKDFVGKGLEQAARIAGTLQSFYTASTHISADYFSKAIEIVDYYITQQQQSVTNGNDPAIVAAHKLYNFLNDESKCDYEYVTTRYLARCSPIRDANELKPVIKTLEEFGLLQDAGKGHLVDGYLARQSWKVNRGYDY